MGILKGELNSTSTYVPAQLTKDEFLVHYTCSNTFTIINVKIDNCELPTFYWLPNLHKCPYKSRVISNSVTALLPFFLSILHLLLQLSKIMLISTVKLLLAIVMALIFGPLKLIEKLRLRNV